MFFVFENGNPNIFLCLLLFLNTKKKLTVIENKNQITNQ